MKSHVPLSFFLTSLVPPKKVAITDENDHKMPESLGSYSEGDSFTLKCTAYGGKLVKWNLKLLRKEEIKSNCSISKLIQGSRDDPSTLTRLLNLSQTGDHWQHNLQLRLRTKTVF